MLGDNDQATSLAYEDRVTGGNKMIKQDYHYSKEQLEEGIIDTRRVATIDNISDPMTKALSRQYIERLLPIMKGTALKSRGSCSARLIVCVCESKWIPLAKCVHPPAGCAPALVYRGVGGILRDSNFIVFFRAQPGHMYPHSHVNCLVMY